MYDAKLNFFSQKEITKTTTKKVAYYISRNAVKNEIKHQLKQWKDDILNLM